MKNVIKTIVSCLLITALCCSMLCSCGSQSAPTNTVTIPDIEKLDVETAKSLLAGKGLIPKVEYEYNNDYDQDLVIRTEPAIGNSVSADTPVTLYVCKGPVYYELPNAVASLYDIEGIEHFIWWSEAEDGIGTKGFRSVRAENGYLYIDIYLKCKSSYKLEFHGDFGTASINDTFSKTVPIEVIYDSKKINNKGKETNFTFKIPLSDLGVQKPTNLYIKTDFLVGDERQTFQADFDLTW